MNQGTHGAAGEASWGAYYSCGGGNRHPDENLVRLIRGTYVEVPEEGRALDIGFGLGANLVFLAQEGYEAHGLEVTEDSVTAAGRLADASGVTLHLRTQKETDLPYPDNYFHLVVSWKAIYYLGTESKVRAAIEDVRRALAPGGVFLFSVLHPDNSGTGALAKESSDGSPITSVFHDPTSEGWKKFLEGFAEVREGYSRFQVFGDGRVDAWRIFWARK